MELKESLSSTRPVGFFDLPLELRRQIYQYCHVLKEAVKALNNYHYHSCDWGMRDRKKTLLLVSKKVGVGATGILYSDNVLSFPRRFR